MDIISHGLWGVLGAKAANVKLREKQRPQRRFDPLLAGFWGVFPDLVAFMPITILFGGGIVSGHLDLESMPRPREGSDVLGASSIFGITRAIYSVSHSAVMLGAILCAVWAFRRFVLKRKHRAFIWEMAAPWALHIFMDFPTHSYRYYPTPILWPISEWRFDGIPWSTPWILGLNYALLAALYLFVRRKNKKIDVAEEMQPAFVAVRADDSG
jgi:hypothetical protein